jgi:hypothetical protein
MTRNSRALNLVPPRRDYFAIAILTFYEIVSLYSRQIYLACQHISVIKKDIMELEHFRNALGMMPEKIRVSRKEGLSQWKLWKYLRTG